MVWFNYIHKQLAWFNYIHNQLAQTIRLTHAIYGIVQKYQ